MEEQKVTKKVILEFDAETERESIVNAVMADSMACAFFDVDQMFRKYSKYGVPENIVKRCNGSLEEFCDFLREEYREICHGSIPASVF
jgi:hypothetical protein